MKCDSKSPPRRYEPQKKFLAISPQAFFEMFMVPESRENEMQGTTAIVDICGPIEQHDGGWCDSYDAIKARVQAAAESEAREVVLRIDSPGGDAAGCFEAVRAVQKICADAGKPLYAYVDGKACSAAYAIASAASAVVLSDSALVGSIGVICTRDDFSAANAARGLRVALITSGARKADGHPDAPITDDELAATQAIVDSMASVFFGLVADMRPTKFKAPAAVGGLNAAMFHGQTAVDRGLADQVMSLDSMLELLASGQGATMAAKSKYEEARAALEETAKGDDANAAAAKRALAAMDDNGTTAAEGDDDAPATDDDDEAPPKKDDEKAEGDDEAPGAEGDDEKPAAVAARGVSSELSALAELHKFKAQYEADKEKTERKTLLASRPDFSPEMQAALRKAPMAVVRDFVKTMPKAPRAKPAATAVVQGTRGASQGGSETSGAVATVHELDRAMGLTTTTLGVRRESHSLVFGVQEKSIERATATSGAAGGAK